MAGTKINLDWTKQSSSPIYDGNYPNSVRPDLNSGAILSGGTIVRGPYNYNDNQAPSDPNYFQGANPGSTLTYSSGFARGSWGASVNDVGPFTTIRTLAPDNYSELYIEFRARMPGTPYGHKFVKPVGRNNDPVGSANITAGIDYAGTDNGGIIEISYGDGTTTSNDTQNTIELDGNNGPGNVGRGWATAQISTPNGTFASTDWGTDWHTFRIFLKFNSGTTAQTEKPDGAYYLEIDGQIYADVGGIFNRHYSNSEFFDGLTLFGVSQGNPGNPAFDFDYDDVKVLQGGFE